MSAIMVTGKEDYYRELLLLTEDVPTKCPAEDIPSAADSGQLNELMDALRAANLQDNDGPLWTLLTKHGFGVVATALMVRLMVRRKKGRGRPTRDSIVKLQAAALHDIKQELRTNRIKSRVHERAIEILEDTHNRCCKAAASEWGLNFAPFDRDRLENHIRRAKRSRAK